MAGRKHKKRYGFLTIIIISIILLLYLAINGDINSLFVNNNTATSKTINEGLSVHLINIGDGDCILIQTDSYNALIDAGHNQDFSIIKEYLYNHGVSSLDMAIATHPHEDHIGSMDDVIREYKPKKVLISPKSHTTSHYENMLDALIDMGIKARIPTPGDTFTLGDASIKVLAPVMNSYKEINDYSIVLMITYGSVDIILTGDAESVSETDMLNLWDSLQADVLKVGHHGSKTSTSVRFLEAVMPRLAVVSAHKPVAVRDRLEEAGIPVYSTSDYGSIVVTTDGKDITISSNIMNEPVFIK